VKFGRLRLKCDGTLAETRFRLTTKRTSPFKSAGASVQSTTGRRVVHISLQGLYCSCKPVFCSHVTLTGYPLHSPVSPSLFFPCVTVWYHISTWLYQSQIHLGCASELLTDTLLPHGACLKYSGMQFACHKTLVMLEWNRWLKNSILAVNLMLFSKCCIWSLCPASPERNVKNTVGQLAGPDPLFTFHHNLYCVNCVLNSRRKVYWCVIPLLSLADIWKPVQFKMC
jgi:hypothetical protein